MLALKCLELQAQRRKKNSTCKCSFVSHRSNLRGWPTPPRLRWPIYLYITINVFIYTSGQSNQSWSSIHTVERWDVSFVLRGRAARMEETNGPRGCKNNIVCFKGAFYLCYNKKLFMSAHLYCGRCIMELKCDVWTVDATVNDRQ